MSPAQRRISSNLLETTGSTDGRRGIPFDYAFRYELQGKPGNVLNSIVTVSIEASFTAVSIGYGVIPGGQPIVFGLPPIPDTGETNFPQLDEINLGDVIEALDNHLAE